MIEKKLVLASHNSGKLAELGHLLSPLGLELIAQSELGVSPAPEPHCTFVENALAKARHASAETGLAAISDDAGLCVDALGGQPGVDTAFYATRFGMEKAEANNITAVLSQMEGITQRQATLVSVLVALQSAHDPQPLIAMGRVRGLITHAPIGDQGFGFDPIVLIESYGKTFAQLAPAVKNSISHRAQAARQMLTLMRERWFA